MDVLIYNDLEPGKLKKQYGRVIDSLRVDDFKSADVKKMVSCPGYYRAKLDDTNRLLFKIGKIKDKRYILILEIILNHEYQNSRFLNGTSGIDESKLIPINKPENISADDCQVLSFLNPKSRKFNFLDKIISFDSYQEEIEKLSLPIIIIGSAGSGKTALSLEKMKLLSGKILYTSLSPFLVENAKNLYFSANYDNKKQEIDFFSFYDLLCSIEVPKGKEIDFRAFDRWIWKYKVSHKIKDSYKIFEEFKGVITGGAVDTPYLSKESYIGLGIKQSIFPTEDRLQIYDLFTKYLNFLKEGEYFDANILSYYYSQKELKIYDYLVIDEVQDITNVQLNLILKCTSNSLSFMLCGDANQIVHPNFFSWSQVKSLFYHKDVKGDIIRVLATNYRNTPEVTKIANQLLLIKNVRFGSIDKESTYLVQANSSHTGEVVFYENLAKIKSDFNQRTRRSAKFAIIVLRNEDKAAARQFFQSPLLFSVQEAKGLEYENVVIFDMISGNEKEFREIASGVDRDELTSETITYGRNRDKADKSLDEYKFYINSLYVAITRAVKNLYVIETQKKHSLLELLGLTDFKQQISFKDQASSDEEWQKEARKLELQGKQEQADAIRKDILHLKEVTWEVINKDALKQLLPQALDPVFFNKKAKDKLYTYSLFYHDIHTFKKLSELKYRPADEWKTKGISQLQRAYHDFVTDNVKAIHQKTDQYGLDFRNEVNLTPLMSAVIFGSEKIASFLIQAGAKTELSDNYGRNALQLILLRAYQNKKLKVQFIENIYSILKKDSLKIRIDNRLVKLEHYQAEFIILNYMMGTLRNFILDKSNSIKGLYWDGPPSYQTSDFMSFFDRLPNYIIPAYRKVRPYISSILSKNEVNRTDKYNKNLFVRMRQGLYLPNPMLEIYGEDGWNNLYDLIDIQDLYDNHCNIPVIRGFLKQIMIYKQKLTADPQAAVSERDLWEGNGQMMEP